MLRNVVILLLTVITQKNENSIYSTAKIENLRGRAKNKYRRKKVMSKEKINTVQKVETCYVHTVNVYKEVEVWLHFFLILTSYSQVHTLPHLRTERGFFEEETFGPQIRLDA